jgi:hypothetical protein
MSYFILSGLNGPLYIFLGLLAWALAYVYLTRVITPDSIGDLMTLIVAILPVFSFILALAVTIVAFSAKKQHVAVGTIFALIAAAALAVAVTQYIRSKDQRSGIRRALQAAANRPHPLRSTIAIISWGLFGAILVFASELGLIFGGWLFLQGSKVWGVTWVVPGAVIFALSLRGGPQTKNPIRRAVLALKDQNHSVGFVDRLLAPARKE